MNAYISGTRRRISSVVLTTVLAIATCGLPGPRANADGWSTPQTISDGTADSVFPRIAERSGPGNYVHVVWRTMGSPSDIQYRRSITGGQSWQSIQTLATGLPAVYPHLATAGNAVHVVWSGDDNVISYLRSTANGGVWDPPVVLSTPATVGFRPDVAASGDDVYVVWIKSDAFDVVFTESHDNGATWSPPSLLTGDGAATEESGVRAAAWGDWVYVVWLADQNVIFRRKGAAMWDFPQTLWTGDSNHVSIAAQQSHVFVDRDDPGGPVQRLSTTNGQIGSWSPPIALGFGDDVPEISAHRPFADHGATVFLDFRDGFDKVFVSTYPLGETQIGTITGSTQNVDIAASRSGNMHVAVNSTGTREVSYHRYTGTRDFDFRWRPPPGGVWKSDAQWADFDGDGDLDLVIAGEDDLGLLVTETYENVFGNLQLGQSLEGVQSESSGNLAWGDYDRDGDVDLLVTGLGAGGRVASLYENDGLGGFVIDAAHTLMPVSGSAAAWGDVDNDGDLDLLVTGTSDDGRLSQLYANADGVLSPSSSVAIVDLTGGSVDWGDWDGDGDADLLLTGYDGANRRIAFYENDPVGTLTDTGAKGLDGLNLSDAAFGDFDGNGTLDLVCTGEMGAGGPRTLYICRNDGLGTFTQIAEPMTIYRSAAAWGDYDADGDLDFAALGYDGAALHTRVYETTSTGFDLAFTLPGVREGAATWADVDSDGRLDLFFTGADWSITYADLYDNIGGDANVLPLAPGVLADETVYEGLKLAWSGATDVETPTDGLYYVLRVGTTPGGHDVVSGTYATPLMGNVGQTTEIVLDVPSDTYFWSARTLDSSLTVSAWSAERTTSYCPLDLDGGGSVAFGDLLQVLSKWGPCDACLEDFNRDGFVNFSDLLLVLSSWGACP